MLDINFRQALTEVSVLSDVLQIVHNHRQYLSLDPVYVNKRYTLPPSYQYQIKKKVSILYMVLRRKWHVNKGVFPIAKCKITIQNNLK